MLRIYNKQNESHFRGNPTVGLAKPINRENPILKALNDRLSNQRYIIYLKSCFHNKKTELRRYNPSYVRYVFNYQLMLKAKFWYLASHSRFLFKRHDFFRCIFQRTGNRICCHGLFTTSLLIPLSNIAGGPCPL